MSELDQIRESIEARIAELNNEMTALQAARAALNAPSASRLTPAASTEGVAKPKRPGPPKAVKTSSTGQSADGASNDDAAAVAPKLAARPVVRAPQGRSRAQTKPTAEKPVEVLLAGKLEAMLGQAGDGLSAVTISKRANAGYDQVLDLLRALESAGQVRRTGSRRTSLWRLISDKNGSQSGRRS
jgi:hypothetical protein